ncbi:SSI family serine proteinase inhibitor [Streptomyces cavernicola]|uniref:SSI family serine proteinase inhibitor n=1 Tax=Streptomyces cavernicola TaxID=3043613 RepID=A0ABT6S975_9ACTN|nr:SSI family serine proteinase inhibitor [Streptomyces sp. B-S-A6]MDI3404661.1 SSI family serine proteinase inhibitor [Streptomyces sp. B-S-A6]
MRPTVPDVRTAAPIALAAAAALLVALAPSALAAPRGPSEPRPGGLFLSVSGAENTWIRGVKLHCRPKPEGTHPQAKAACAALDQAHGEFDELAGAPRACSAEHDPVTVSATGTHRGRITAWHKTFANSCEMHAATDPVFDF